MAEQPISIAYLGPEGTYCNEAAVAFARKMGASDVEYVAVRSFPEVFDAVDRGKCTYGVVATENSLEGPVTATLDNFAFNSSAIILGVHVVDIHHCLVVNPDAEMADVERITSHSQALGQCRQFLLRNYPNLETATASSTADSVRLVMEHPETAAIGTRFAAERYGARIVEEGIEDRLGDQTSFALIGRPGMATPLSGTRHRTSVALFLKADRAGALQMILSEFAYANVNITMIQSRPTKQALGDYMFFLDLEGHADDPAMQTALNCLRLKLREVKMLGSYPID